MARVVLFVAAACLLNPFEIHRRAAARDRLTSHHATSPDFLDAALPSAATVPLT